MWSVGGLSFLFPLGPPSLPIRRRNGTEVGRGQHRIRREGGRQGDAESEWLGLARGNGTLSDGCIGVRSQGSGILLSSSARPAERQSRHGRPGFELAGAGRRQARKRRPPHDEDVIPCTSGGRRDNSVELELRRPARHGALRPWDRASTVLLFPARSPVAPQRPVVSTRAPQEVGERLALSR